jgi:hypothetical protein
MTGSPKLGHPAHHLDKVALEEMLDIKAMYYDLLMCVSNKVPGETRHQTAKRYLIEREAQSDNTAKEGR